MTGACIVATSDFELIHRLDEPQHNRTRCASEGLTLLAGHTLAVDSSLVASGCYRFNADPDGNMAFFTHSQDAELVWKNILARLAYGTDLVSALLEHDRYKTRAFANFLLCDHYYAFKVIDSVTSARLARDFANLESAFERIYDVAIEHLLPSSRYNIRDEWFALYRLWRRAFEIASRGGMVYISPYEHFYDELLMQLRDHYSSS